VLPSRRTRPLFLDVQDLAGLSMGTWLALGAGVLAVGQALRFLTSDCDMVRSIVHLLAFVDIPETGNNALWL
jgi:hypothetical protein